MRGGYPTADKEKLRFPFNPFLLQGQRGMESPCFDYMLDTGFEPVYQIILSLENSALDRSANQAVCIQWGSNPRGRSQQILSLPP